MNGHYTPDAGDEYRMFCDVCRTEMNVKRNKYGPRTMCESMAGHSSVYDLFVCSNREFQWHKKIYRIQEFMGTCPSDKLRAIMGSEIREILDSNIYNEKKYKMIEIWKPIINYDGLYEISNWGRVKRFNRNKHYKPFKILNPAKTKGGYLRVGLWKNNVSKTYVVHKLVIEAFIGLLPDGKEICHNDGNGENNFIENLRYDTHKNNTGDEIKHGTKREGSKCWNAKLNNDKIIKIRKLAENGELSQREIAIKFNVSQYAIWNIVNKKTWKHL